MTQSVCIPLLGVAVDLSVVGTLGATRCGPQTIPPLGRRDVVGGDGVDLGGCDGVDPSDGNGTTPTPCDNP
jgi:hypothetical protein